MKLAIFAFTTKGGMLGARIADYYEQLGDEVFRFLFYKYHQEQFQPFHQMKASMEEIFHNVDAICFVSATGIAVRSIAPFLQSKTTDPAVLVLDEGGKFVISLLSGHIGGANELCTNLADYLHCVPVITTATDVNHILSIDVWAKQHGLCIDDMEIAKEISAGLLEGIVIGYQSELSRYPCPNGLVEKFEGTLEEDIEQSLKEQSNRQWNGQLKEKLPRLGVYVSYDNQTCPFERTLHLLPKNLVLGIGCRKHIEEQVLFHTVESLCREHKISLSCIRRVTSISLKSEEPAIHGLCDRLGVPFQVYSSKELEELEGEFSSSSFVKSVTGVDCVCERSAVLGSNGGTLLVNKQARNGVTIAIAVEKS